jgi:hypothetical protein
VTHIEMNEHLPECALAEDDQAFASWMIDECICDRLRACEEQVTAAALQRVAALVSTSESGWSSMKLVSRDEVVAAIIGGW